MTKLKPCPFCGSKEIKIGLAEASECPYVYCDDCGSRGAIRILEQQAVNSWNRRAK